MHTSMGDIAAVVNALCCGNHSHICNHDCIYLLTEWHSSVIGAPSTSLFNSSSAVPTLFRYQFTAGRGFSVPFHQLMSVSAAALRDQSARWICGSDAAQQASKKSSKPENNPCKGYPKKMCSIGTQLYCPKPSGKHNASDKQPL
eukprot:GHRR01017201.1.p1 GENE.GHRR01017201.1~~GHRR01017201.1.p1  ORF type:complete len:144 (-),score=19.00 GHRR01017201.1:571-1002(-)